MSNMLFNDPQIYWRCLRRCSSMMSIVFCPSSLTKHFFISTSKFDSFRLNSLMSWHEKNDFIQKLPHPHSAFYNAQKMPEFQLRNLLPFVFLAKLSKSTFFCALYAKIFAAWWKKPSNLQTTQRLWKSSTMGPPQLPQRKNWFSCKFFLDFAASTPLEKWKFGTKFEF